MPRKSAAVALGVVAAFNASAVFAQATPASDRSGEAAGQPAKEPASQSAAPASDSKPGPAGSDARVSFETFAQHSFRTDLSSNTGDVSVSTAGFSLGLAVPAAARTNLAFGLEGEYRWYDFRNAVRTEPLVNRARGKLWKDTEQLAATVIVSHQFNDTWAAFVGGGVDSSREVGAEFNDSLTYGGIFGATYQLTESFRLGASLAIRSRLEDSAFFVPVPIIDWKINDQWRLNTDRKVHRAGLNLVYTPCEAWSVTLSGGVQSGEFRLVDNGAASEGVGRDWRVPVVIEVAWRPDPHVELALFAGSEVWGQITLDDRNGNELQQNDLDPTLLVGGAVTLRW